MIRTEKLVPENYSNKSRDFQLLGRVFDVVFNYLKTNIDSVQSLPLSRNSNKQMLDLLSTTLGFKARHTYSDSQLYAVCSSLSEIMRCKGTLRSIELLMLAIYQADGIDDLPRVDVDHKEKVVTLNCSVEIIELALLNDVIDYILPAGMRYKIVKSTEINNVFETPLSTGNLTINIIDKSINKSIVLGEHQTQGASKKDTPGVEGYQEDNVIGFSDIRAGRIDNAIILKHKTEEQESNEED